MNLPDVAEHVDTGTVLTRTEPDPTSGRGFRAGTDAPFVELWLEALAAAEQGSD